MKILITGATGFIGKNLSIKLLESGHSVYALLRENSNTNLHKGIKFYMYHDFEDLDVFIKKEKFDGVIHLASLFLPKHTEKDIRDLIDSNIYFGTILLELAKKNNIRWFINTGTFWQHYKDKKYSPVNLYAATKQAFEDIAKYYTETSDLVFVTLKLSDTFGKGDTRSKIMNLWDNISRTGEILEMSKGEQILDISHVDDVVNAFLILVKKMTQKDFKKLKNKSFALKSKNRLNLRNLAKIFEKATGKKLNINWGAKPYREREVMRPWSKGISIPGWKQKKSLEKSIKDTFK